MKAINRTVIGSTLAVLLGFISATARAASYNYTLVVQTGGVFSNVSAGNMNNLGTVTFQGVCTNGLRQSLPQPDRLISAGTIKLTETLSPEQLSPGQRNGTYYRP